MGEEGYRALHGHRLASTPVGFGVIGRMLAVAMVLASLGACGRAVQSAGPVESSGGIATTVPSPSTVATSTSPSPSPSPAAPSPSSLANGQLRVTPNAGRVGSTVVIQGQGCNNPGSTTSYLVFEGQGITPGIVGATEIEHIPTDATGYFSFQYVIPSQLHSLQGRGGGAVTPGTYQVISRPSQCQADFTVTT